MLGTMTSAGLDVHARSVRAFAFEPVSGEVWSARLSTDPARVAAWLEARPRPLRVVYEAGPTGFGLARYLKARGLEVMVCAPAKTPREAVVTAKTDRRDAELLARHLVAGGLHPILIPSVHAEAAREVTRLRLAVAAQIRHTKQRITSRLLAHGELWPATTWTVAHRQWLSTLRFGDPQTRWVLDDLIAELAHQQARIVQLDERVLEIANDPEFRAPTERLACFRGLDTLAAISLQLEILDWQRFPRAASFANFVGLTTRVAQSGQHTTYGSITKAGSVNARRVLVGAAKHAYRAPRPSIAITRRRRDQPPPVVALAERVQQRLYHRYHALTTRGKPPNEATVACARELAEHLWRAVTMP